MSTLSLLARPFFGSLFAERRDRQDDASPSMFMAAARLAAASEAGRSLSPKMIDVLLDG